MTELNIPFDELLQEAVAACGEIDAETADLLKAMYSDESETYGYACLKQDFSEIEICKSADTENSLQAPWSRLGEILVFYEGFGSLEAKFKDVVVEYFLGGAMHPGIVEDMIFELRHPDFLRNASDFSLYEEIVSKMVIFYDNCKSEQSTKCKEFIYNHVESYDGAWHEQFFACDLRSEYDAWYQSTHKCRKVKGNKVRHFDWTDGVWVKSDADVSFTENLALASKPLEMDGMVLSIRTGIKPVDRSPITKGVVHRVDVGVLSMLSRQIDN